MKFAVKCFFSECDQIRIKTGDLFLLTFAEEIFKGKLELFCSVGIPDENSNLRVPIFYPYRNETINLHYIAHCELLLNL